MPIRIALVALNAERMSGVPRYTRALARALDSVSPEFAELEMTLISTSAGMEAIAPVSLQTARIDPLAGRTVSGPLRLALEQVVAIRYRADLTHYFDVNGPFLAPRRQFVLTFHDASLRRSDAYFTRLQRAYKNRVYRWSLTRAAAVVAVSRFSKEEAIRHFRVDPESITIIPSGPGLIPLAAPAEAATRERPYLLFVGNLTSSKNVPFLVRAFAKADVAVDLVLAGGRLDDLPSIKREIWASGARERIRIVRAPDDAEVDRLYRGALALLFPTRYEGFGFPPLEAMQRECPVLASDIPVMREIAGAGAMLVPLHEQRWVEAIRRIVSDSGLRTTLRRRGRVTVAQYGWEKAARALCNVFACLGSRRT